MKNEKIQEFLGKLQNYSNSSELMKGMEAPCNQDEEIKAYAELAGKLGYDITESDLKEYLNWASNRMQQKTEEASSQIQKLSDEILDKVAGGKDHDDCKDTYKDSENCWFNDGCDNVINYYDEYVCNHVAFDLPCHRKGY